MAFKRSGWRLVGGENRDGNGGQVFSYVNVDDTNVEIKASGYFNDIAKAVSKNDIIWIIGSNGLTFAAVDTSGKPITVSPGIPNDVETGIIANPGGGQGGATVVKAFANYVDTVGTTGDSLIMPTASIRGQTLHVFNTTGTTATLFPFLGEQLNDEIVNASITLANQRAFDSDGNGIWRDH